MRKPSRLAVATSGMGMPHHASASTQEMTNDPDAAFHAGRRSATSATINQTMGKRANMKGMARSAIDKTAPNDIRYPTMSPMRDEPYASC